MDPHSFIARAEAQRWLGIAEKLLMGRDLVGSKTFAIRARESDPRLEPADQILAIADTLLAAEKRVGSNNQMDWYSILQLVRLTHDSELIAGQYRRLALLLNPNKTQLPYADQAFQLVAEAWSVLSNPLRKSLYDSELNFQHHHHHQYNQLGFQEVPQPQQQQPQHHQQQHHQQHNFFSQPERPFEIRPQPQQHQPQQQQQQHNFFSPQPIPIEQPIPVRPFQGRSAQQQQPRQPPPSQQPPPPQQQQPQTQRQSPPPALQQPQPQQQLRQHQQQPQQQQQSIEQNAAHVKGPREGNNGVREERETNNAGNVGDASRFWTACPFCFHMYEYFRVYAECTMRCQNCMRAFQAVAVSPPPVMVEGKEALYYCWGFFPFGISASSWEKNKGKISSWAPFSPMFTGPAPQAQVKKRRNYYTGPRIYIDDHVDDVFMGISEPSEDSDIDWGSTRKKKKKKSKKVKGLKKNRGRKKVKHVLVVKRAEDVNMENGESIPVGIPIQDGVLMQNVSVAEMSKKAETSKKAESNKKAVGTAPRRQSGRVAKELGKLDLNVEFNNNEGEEPAPGMTAGNRGGHGDEDNIEGIGFFEGLDEFLSSLPILSVVGDDKVKAA